MHHKAVTIRSNFEFVRSKFEKSKGRAAGYARLFPVRGCKLGILVQESRIKKEVESVLLLTWRPLARKVR